MPQTANYAFKGAYPTAKTVQRAYDEAELNRAIMGRITASSTRKLLETNWQL